MLSLSNNFTIRIEYSIFSIEFNSCKVEFYGLGLDAFAAFYRIIIESRYIHSLRVSIEQEKDYEKRNYQVSYHLQLYWYIVSNLGLIHFRGNLKIVFSSNLQYPSNSTSYQMEYKMDRS